MSVDRRACFGANIVEGHCTLDGVSTAVRNAAATITATRWQKEAGAIRALWLAGDAVRSLRSHVHAGGWRESLRRLAAAVKIHPKRLDDAERASSVFREEERERFLHLFEHAAGLVTASHVVELARASGRRRTSGLQALAQSPLTVRQLRAHLRAGNIDPWRACGPEPTTDEFNR